MLPYVTMTRHDRTKIKKSRQRRVQLGVPNSSGGQAWTYTCHTMHIHDKKDRTKEHYPSQNRTGNPSGKRPKFHENKMTIDNIIVTNECLKGINGRWKNNAVCSTARYGKSFWNEIILQQSLIYEASLINGVN